MSPEPVDPRKLASACPPAQELLVVLDFDGTLAPLVAHPDDARLADGAHTALEHLSAITAVVVSSGRDVDDLRQRTGGLDVLLAGGHGARIVHGERTLAEIVDASDVEDTLDAAERAVRELLDGHHGWVVERKPTSLAVHYRMADAADAAEHLPDVRALLSRDLDRPPGFALLDGKAVVELRPAGIDKGRALDWLTDRHPQLRPLVVGDDVTDEDAFVRAADHSGIAVLVADRDRPSAAAYRLRDPQAVVAFLDGLARVAARS